MLAAQIGNGRAGIGLLEYVDDLAVAVTGLFHVEATLYTFNENFPLNNSSILGEDYPLFGLMKWLKGKKPTKIVDSGNGKYKVYRGDKYHEIEKKVIQLYQDYKVRKAMESAISGTLTEEKISKIFFTKDKGKTFQEVDFSEKEYFSSLPETKTILDEQTFETNIHLGPVNTIELIQQ